MQLAHEGTLEVRRARKNSFIQQCETFQMHQGEKIVDIQKKFSHIVNHLKDLGKVFEEERQET